jgi:hypothetical protein
MPRGIRSTFRARADETLSRPTYCGRLRAHWIRCLFGSSVFRIHEPVFEARVPDVVARFDPASRFEISKVICGKRAISLSFPVNIPGDVVVV